MSDWLEGFLSCALLAAIIAAAFFFSSGAHLALVAAGWPR